MANWNQALTGALTGGGVGGAFGPAGSLIGASLGGLTGLLGGGRSKPAKFKQQPMYSPQQMQAFNDILQQAQGGNKNAFNYLNSILSDEEGAFEDFERPYQEQFQQQTVPSILERFSGAGARSSSGLNQTLGQAARGLSGDLAAQRAQLKNSAIQQLLNYTNTGLQRTTTPYIQERRPGLFEQLQGPAQGGFSELINMLRQKYAGGANV